MSAVSNLNSFLTIIDTQLAACDPNDYKEMMHLVKLRAYVYDALGLNGGTISGGSFEVGLTQSQATAAIDASVDIESIKTSLTTLASDLALVKGFIDQVELKLDNVNGSTTDVGTLLTDTNSKLDTSNTRLNTIISNVDGLEGFTDGLETLVGTVNTNLSTLITNLDGVEGSIDGLESLIGATNTLITALNGYVDGIESLLGTSNNSLSDLDTKLTAITGFIDGLEALIASTNTKLDTLIANNSLLYPTTTVYSVIAPGTSHGVVKASPGRIHSLSCTNMTTQVRWFMLFNKTSNPTTSEVPSRTPYPVYGNNGFLTLDSDYFSKQGNTFSNGIAWGLSTSPNNYQPSDGTLVITEITYV